MSAFGDSVGGSVARMVALHGEAMILKRAGQIDISLKGKRIPGSLDEVGDNGAAQQQFRVKIATTEIAASNWAVKEPKRTDRITIGGRERMVLDAKALGAGGVVALYELLVAG